MTDARSLILDDHPPFTAALTPIAAAWRPCWKLRGPSTARRAPEPLSRRLPEFAIADVGLPGEDGFAVLAEIA